MQVNAHETLKLMCIHVRSLPPSTRLRCVHKQTLSLAPATTQGNMLFVVRSA